MIRMMLCAAAAAAAAVATVPGSSQAAMPSQHVLFVVSDDLGFNDVGFHGSEIK